MKSKLINLLIISLLIVILSSCRNNADIERAVETFFVLVIQVISFMLFGVAGLILSIIGATSKSNTAKIIGGILIGLFTLISVICLLIILNINPKRDYIYFAFFIDFVIIGISTFFLTKSKTPTDNLAQIVNDDYLEKIIESEIDKDIDELDSI